MKTFVAFLLSISLGCATLLANKSSNVTMQSTPDNAEVYVDGVRVGTSPVTLKLENSKGHIVSFRKGNLEATVDVDRKLGAGWVVLDILFGFVPLVIDAATGAWYELDTKTVNVKLVH